MKLINQRFYSLRDWTKHMKILKSFLKNKYNNNKENHYNKNNYITKNNNENNKYAILNNNNNDKVIDDNHNQNVVLLSKKDDSGKYYTCYNCCGEKIQFFWESQSAKIEYTLRIMDDFPVWGNYFKEFFKKEILVIF